MTRLSYRNAEWSHVGFTLFLLTFCVLGSIKQNAYAADPRTPVDGAEILQTINLLSNQNSDELKQLRKQLKLSPIDVKLATRLSKAYIEIARENTDVRYYGYAQAVLKPWWKEQAPPAEVLLLRATLNQQKHQYAKAMDDLKQLLTRQPGHAQAWLTLSIIQQVQGDYQSARVSCSNLAATTSTWLSSLCHSQVLSLTGSAERAYKMQQSIAFQLASGPPDLLQWVLGHSAETALRLGRKVQAEKHFKQALALPLHDAYLLRVYSDYLLNENRAEDVLALLKDEQQDSALLLRMAIAARQTGNIPLTRGYQKLLESRFRAASLRGSKLHERDEAHYLLEFTGDLQKALKLAVDNWNIQKEPDDALILLRVALANDSGTDIQIIRAWISKTKLQDVRIQTLLKGRKHA